MRKLLTKSTMGVLIVACLLILTVFIGSFVLVGCAPSGFLNNGAGGTHPLYYNGPSEFAIYSIRQQFYELNKHEYTVFFIFDDEIHSLEKGIIYREATVVGKLVEITEEWRTTQRYVQMRANFVYENYLFYWRTKTQSRFALFAHAFRRVYSRNEYFRFCLLTGNNEEIRLTQFVEALQTIDSNWVINPNYRGEK